LNKLVRFCTFGLALAMFGSSAIAAPENDHKPLKAPAWAIYLTLDNNSNSCAWITIYRATFYLPWSIVGEAEGRPRFVRPHAKQVFGFVFPQTPVPVPGEMKVRAEVTRNADCSGGTIRDIDSVNKSIFPDSGAGGIKGTFFVNLSGDNPYSLGPIHH